jgi:hypothetical protein
VNEYSASRPAAAGPTVNPRLIARRYIANAVTRSPAVVRSVRSAAEAGRYASAARPASTARARIAGSERACESASIAAAEANIERAIEFRRPSRSAS